MSNKERYRLLCEQEKMPLFLQYWWLEGVCAGKDWDVLLSFGSANEAGEAPILAAMPYQIEKRYWLRHVSQPDLCCYGGIWFAPSEAVHADRVARLTMDIDRQLKALKLVSYNQFYLPNTPAQTILTSLGYRFSNRRTYVLDDLSDIEQVVGGFSKNKRKKLEKQTLTYRVCELEAEEFYYYHLQTSAQKKMKLQYTRELLLVMSEKAMERGQMRILGVRDAQDELLAASVLVWDEEYVYQLLDTFDHDQPDSGARELLTLEAIKYARQLGRKFDFSYHRDYLKHYGAQRVNYLSVHQGKSFFILLQRLHTWKRTK